ncbi:MAG TPA: hypothetical protein VHC91_08760, partial [Trinickia sp.]|nr:hypothetical protein [Trinickia sp.]
QGKARQGKARQGKARQGKARQGKARQGKARQGKARQGKARQGKGIYSGVDSYRSTVLKRGSILYTLYPYARRSAWDWRSLAIILLMHPLCLPLKAPLAHTMTPRRSHIPGMFRA